jgi:hypothetical protein
MVDGHFALLCGIVIRSNGQKGHLFSFSRRNHDPLALERLSRHAHWRSVLDPWV